MPLNALIAALARFVAELQRRKVLRVAAAYVVGAWIVLQVALALQTAMSLSGQFSATMLALLVIGFFVAVVLTWFFEITPEGVKRTAPAAGDAPLVKTQTTDLALAGALLLVVIVAVAQLLMPTPTAPATTTTEAATAKPPPPALGDKSIAVLPFANLSPDKENEYFADGLTEELLNLLAKIGDLKVISRTSSFAFKGKETPLPEIAKQLGVRHILEGSVRTEGDDLRITAQLIDVSTDTHLWTETYERKIDNIFALQDEIARDIAGALKVEVTFADSGAEAPTKNLEAYRLYLKARALHARRNEGDLEEGVELNKQAIALDPKFAEAHAGLATGYAAMAARQGAPFKELRSLARQSANTALELNPNLARAYGVVGTLARQELAWQAAIENFSRAIALDPSDSVTLVSFGAAQSMIGEFEQAKRTRDKALRIDPIYGSLGLVTIWPVLDAFAVRDDRKVAELANKFIHARGDVRALSFALLSTLARERNDTVAAERNIRAAVGIYDTPGPVVDAIVRALKSRAAFAEAAVAINTEAARDPKFDPGAAFFVIGDYDRFFDALDARVARGDTARFNLLMPFAWRAASADKNSNQRFKTLARKIGVVDYWKAHGWPDRCRAKGEDDFECS